MKQLISPQLAQRLHHITEEVAYVDKAFYYPLADPNGPVDDYGRPTTSQQPVPIKCSFTDSPHIEQWRDLGDIAGIEAEIRFRDIFQPVKGGEILLTEHFGDQSFVDKKYEIIGVRDRGTFGYMCALKKVTI